MPGGRPSKYTKPLAAKICAQLAMGKSMRTVCKQKGMPAMSTVFKWLNEKPEFSEQYEKAKQEAADAMVEEMLEIADDGSNDFYDDIIADIDPETTVADLDKNAILALLAKHRPENVQRSRLRVDTRKWISSKLKPKKYGDRTIHQGDDEAPLYTKIEHVIKDP